MARATFSLLLALFALSFSHPTASHSYVSFKGKKQGQLRAQEVKSAREKDGWFEIVSFEFTSEIREDPKTGRPNGVPVRVLMITKKLDEASPMLQNAHVTNETFETVAVQTVDDANKVTDTFTLKNALISSIQKNGLQETVVFTYASIEDKK
jgi:type VI secretion system Hcp family effector